MSSLPAANLPPRLLGPRRGIDTRRRQILRHESAKLEEDEQKLQERLNALRDQMDQQKQRISSMNGTPYWKSGGKNTPLSQHANVVLEEKHQMLNKYNLAESTSFAMQQAIPKPGKFLRPVGSATTRKTWNVPLQFQSLDVIPSTSRFQLPFSDVSLPSLQSRHISTSMAENEDVRHDDTTSSFLDFYTFPDMQEEKNLSRPSTCSTEVQANLTCPKTLTTSQVSSQFKIEFTKQLSLLDQWLLRKLKEQESLHYLDEFPENS
ncbi:hypothetical protein HMI54_013047 [Coelomomyces lativittatus]|nr:hypothetical protein HMI56_007377 [Coelomomyces lativittatus]KAJ1514991.1 hypothetical protein HMI54_013047 [Coelomomyces lativittatus]